jgi:hypothetical protein
LPAAKKLLLNQTLIKMKKHLRLFLLGLALVGSLASYGQKKKKCVTYRGIKAGLSVPNLLGSSNDPLSKDFKSRLGLDAGATIEHPINKHFSFLTGLTYSQQGGKRNGYQAIAPITAISQGGYIADPNNNLPIPILNGSYIYSDVKNTGKFNYLLLPVQIKYKYALSKKINVYAAAGLFGGVLLSAKNVNIGNSAVYAYAADSTKMQIYTMSNNTANIRSSLHKFNVGFIGTVGFEYVTPKSKWFIEGGGNYGFIPIQKDAVNGKNNIGAGTVSVGYARKFEELFGTK